MKITQATIRQIIKEELKKFLNEDLYASEEEYEEAIKDFMELHNVSREEAKQAIDAAGDEMVITDTASQIFTGITTATKGTACYALNAFAGLAETDRLHVFCKTNAGSLTADFCEITWGEI